jgi:hypothetical protein
MTNGADTSAPFSFVPACQSVASVTALTTLATRVGCPCRVVLEVAAAVLAAFSACFGRTLRVFREIAFTASVFGHGACSWVIEWTNAGHSLHPKEFTRGCSTLF